MFWGLVFVVAMVVADHFCWPIQAVFIVAISGLFVLLDDLEGGINHAHNMIVSDLQEKLNDEESGME